MTIQPYMSVWSKAAKHFVRNYGSVKILVMKQKHSQSKLSVREPQARPAFPHGYFFLTVICPPPISVVGSALSGALS